ncbi:Gfo/Idh/MocA family oxidoreductase [Marispirochaeta aestuarii]|uniref:Gfo/Idh/MocA family protein n=1 Tax=Marispirochaeta aestuarii TaxID=1963862 RepID=UPI0029C805A8|nr:Gfo/Idh/MocA family oxidoreductase [Marispirochaeta aestuarii]
MEHVRWGVVGAGHVCENMSGPPLYLVAHSSLELVHRRNREEGEEFVIRHGKGRYVESFSELVESGDIDAVYIATPTELHEEQALGALEAGKHVLVEHPMAPGSGSCERMLQAADRAKRKLGVALYRRGYPSVEKVRTVVQSGLIGTPIAGYVNSEFSTSQRIDLMRYLMGEMAEISLRSADVSDIGYDSASPLLCLMTGKGIPVTMSLKWTETGMPEGLLIEGDQGIVHLQDLKGGEILVIARGGEEKISLSVPGLPFSHWGIVENFVESLTAGSPLLCSGEDALNLARIMEGISRAKPGGRAISL